LLNVGGRVASEAGVLASPPPPEQLTTASAMNTDTRMDALTKPPDLCDSNQYGAGR
jgi:hypothetical protein